MSKTLFFSFIILLVSCHSVQKYNAHIQEKIDIKTLKSEMDYLYEKIQVHHPHLYEYTTKTDLEKKLDSIKSSITKPMSPLEFYPLVKIWVNEIKQGHNGVQTIKSKKTKEEIKKTKNITFPLKQFSYFIDNGHLYVLKNRSSDSTIALGSRINTIDGKNVDSLIKNIKTQYTSDGYNKTFYRHYIARGFADMYYNRFIEKDSLFIQFSYDNNSFDKIIVNKIAKKYKNKNDSIRITDSIAHFKKLSKKERKKIIAAQNKKAEQKRLYDYNHVEKEYNRELKFYNDSTVAYLKIKSFAYGPSKKFYKEVFAKIDSAKSQFLILDFRNNSGGRLADIEELNTYLPYKEPTAMLGDTQVGRKFSFLRVISNIEDWFTKFLLSPYVFFRSLFTVKHVEDGYFVQYSKKKTKVKPTAFKGKIYVMINGLCFSATSIISSQIDSFGDNVTFVGEEAGGDYNGTVAGVFNRITLPQSKVKIYHGLMHIQPNNRRETKGRGIFPDVEIIPTIQQIVSKKDVEIDWILQDISTQTN